MIQITMTVERDEREIEVNCEFDAVPAYRGARDSLCGKRNAGPPLEPDAPSTVEFVSAVIAETGEPIVLTDREILEAENKACSELD